MISAKLRGALVVAIAAGLLAFASEATELGPPISSIGPVPPIGESLPAPIHDRIEFVEADLEFPADPPPAPPGPPTNPYLDVAAGPLGVYFGGIFHPVVIPEDDLDFLESDIGWGFVVGYAPASYPEFLGAIGIEFAFEFSEHNDKDFNDTADYTQLLVGFKAIDTTIDQIQPYVTFGLGFYDVTYDKLDYDIDGVGGYFGGGIDFFIDSTFSVGIDLKLHSWEGDDNFGVPGSVFSPSVGLMFLAHF